MNFSDALPFFTALVIGLLLGLERERAHGKDNTSIALGVRTLTVLSLIGASCAALGDLPLTIVAGLTAGALLVSSYIRKFISSDYKISGLTSEFTAIASFTLGYMAYSQSQIAVIIAIIILTLLVLKDDFHRFARRKITNKERSAAVIFLIISFVVLPLLPDEAIDPFGLINPTKLWLVFVLIVGIEFASYIALRLFKGQLGLMLSGIFGGFISSTATALNLSQYLKKSQAAPWPILCALTLSETSSLAMQLFLLSLLAPSFALIMAPVYVLPILILSLAALVLYNSKIKHVSVSKRLIINPENPITIKRSIKLAGTIIAVLFIVSMITHLFNDNGLYIASFLGGITSARAVIIAISEVLNASVAQVPSALIGIIFAMSANALFKIYIVAKTKNTPLIMAFTGIMMLAVLMAVISYFLITHDVFNIDANLNKGPLS